MGPFCQLRCWPYALPTGPPLQETLGCLSPLPCRSAALQVPALSPRQLKLLSKASLDKNASAVAATAQGMIQEIPRDYLLNRLGGVVGKK